MNVAHHNAFELRAARWLFVAFFCLYLATGSISHFGFGDGGFMLDIANNLAANGFGPMPLVEGGVNKTKWGLGQILLDFYVVYAGRLVSSRPKYEMFRFLLTSALPAAIGASVPCLVYLSGLRLQFRAQHALLAAFTVGLGTMTWVYAQTLFSEPLVGACWALTTYALISFDKLRMKRWLCVAGIASGYALLAKATCGLVLPIIVLYGIVSSCRQMGIHSVSSARKHFRAVITHSLILVTPMLFFIGVYFWYNWLRFGDLLETGYSIERDGQFGFNTPLLTGLYGLILSSGKGFFFYNPIALLGVFGARAFLRARPREALLLFGLIGITVVAHARWWAWHGDIAWGPRFLVTLTPCFAVLSLPWIRDALGRNALRATRVTLLAGLLASSIGVQCLGLCFSPLQFSRLTTDETTGLIGGPYDAQMRPTRDDGLASHFIPEFSPLAGHFWMLRAALAETTDERDEIMLSPPWRSLNPKRVNRSLISLETDIDIWWVAALRQYNPLKALLLGIACLLFAGFAIAARRAVSACAASAAPLRQAP